MNDTLKTYKVTQERYFKNPAKWFVLYCGWNPNGNAYAVCHKVKDMK